jgi:hypothetical protein
MPCLLVVLALMVPRLVVAALWLFTGWFEGVFPTLLWPVLGFLFLPLTLLWYSAFVNWYGAVWSIVPVLGLILALLVDLSPARGSARS